MSDTLATLQAKIESRKNASPDRSYVAYLHSRGLNKILEKIGEESTEVILAAKDVNPESGAQALIEETADLWFHSMIMLSHLGLSYEEVVEALGSRMHQSGLMEKASRSNSHSSK